MVWSNTMPLLIPIMINRRDNGNGNLFGKKKMST